jgi:uncharacterized protein
MAGGSSRGSDLRGANPSTHRRRRWMQRSVIVVRMKLLRVVAGLLFAAWAHAAPLAPALQDELDRAVIDYQSGRFDAARAAFESLAGRGVAAANYDLAVMHLRGELPQADPATALKLLERATAGGFVTAQFMLGLSYETGDIVARDLARSAAWYTKAAEGGSVDAAVALGTAYYLGRGVARDAAAAARWYREGAKGGDVGAQYLLASMYESGEGVERDLRLARYWYDIAARNGDEAAPGKVKELDAKLTSAPS